MTLKLPIREISQVHDPRNLRKPPPPPRRPPRGPLILIAPGNWRFPGWGGLLCAPYYSQVGRQVESWWSGKVEGQRLAQRGDVEPRAWPAASDRPLAAAPSLVD